MGRNASPLALHGGYQGGKGDREAAAAATVQVDQPLGDYPGIDPAERELWNQLKAQFPAGALKATDQLGAELLVKLWAKSRREPLKKVEFSQLYALMGKFGLNPADRSKVKVKPAASGPSKTGLSRFKKEPK